MRVRSWDSCQYALFTLHASGHNPRPLKKARMRQRVMHKFSYARETAGTVFCSGCGRCVRACPVNLDIRRHAHGFQGSAMKNPYVPLQVTIEDVVIENELRDIKTFRLAFERDEDRAGFSYLPGQFAELSLFGTGESPIGIASSPTEEGYLLFSVKRTGVVTSELHASAPGRRMGVRGPLGHPFPWERLEGKNILIVSGGFAFTTLRSAITYMLDPAHRKMFGKITAVYGAREPGELLYKKSIAEWEASVDIEFTPTIDRQKDGWTGKVGLVPNVVKELAPVCGEHPGARVRPADHDQIHHPCAPRAGIPG